MRCFFATVEATLENSTRKGNITFCSEELTEKTLEKVKTTYCKKCSNSAQTYYPDQACITFVCEIEP